MITALEMNKSRITRTAAIAALTASMFSACGSDDDASLTTREPTPATTISDAVTVPPTSPATTPGTSTTTPATTTPATTTPATTPPTTIDDVTMTAFQADVAEICGPGAATLAAMPPNDGTIETASANIATLRQARTDGVAVASVEAPGDLAPQLAEVVERDAEAEEALSDAETAAAAGDVAAAEEGIDVYVDKLASNAAQFAIMGASCGPADATRAANADLNVLVERNGSQMGAGFGSVWVSEGDGGTVVRIDPDSGEILARIEAAEGPGKLQPADGKIWVRALDEYVRIDPDTNEVDATLPKADVGPAANRNWALDGAMWICDGRKLHRYDPTTIDRVAVIDIDIACEYVFATDDLVVVWTYNDDPSLRLDPATVMIDPTTNQVLATIPLPNDVVFPAVFDDRVFFAGDETPISIVIDRATWTVASTHDLGRPTGGGGIVSNGELIFVPTEDASPDDVLVVDAVTYEVVDTIEPLDVNHVAVLDGSLWLTQGALDVVQRFDLES